MTRCRQCPARAVQRHHVIYRQHLRSAGGDPADTRNLVPLCKACHDAHHARQTPLPLRLLPDSVYTFAAELLGPDAAYVYLQRRYSGGDDRLDALVA